MPNTPFDDRVFWVYPWDIDDGDPRESLQVIRRLGANAISIPFSYHSVRALAPKRTGKKIINTAAAIYFRPRAGEFAPRGIQPLCSEWATEDGPIPNLFALATNAGLRVRAWTVVFHNSPLATASPDSAITNCFGEVFVHALCPSAPKSRDFAIRLVRAICARPIHAIELEAAGFYGYEHLSIHDKCGIAFDLFHHFLFSCCFCISCRQGFSSLGLDPASVAETFRNRLRQFFDGNAPTVNNAKQATHELGALLGEDVAAGLLQVRTRCILDLLQEFRSLVPPGIELTVTSALSPIECSALFGAQPTDTLRIADRLLLVVLDPDERSFRKRFEDALECSSDAARWIAGIRVFPPDVRSERTIESRITFLWEKGFRALQLYHYGLAPRHLLVVAARCWQSPNP